MKDFSPRYVGILACGLRGVSRVFGAISGDNITLDTKLNARILDCLEWIVWSKTVDGEHNRNRPQSIYDLITGNAPKQNENTVKFRDSTEFEKARARILEGK